MVGFNNDDFEVKPDVFSTNKPSNQSNIIEVKKLIPQDILWSLLWRWFVFFLISAIFFAFLFEVLYEITKMNIFEDMKDMATTFGLFLGSYLTIISIAPLLKKSNKLKELNLTIFDNDKNKFDNF